MSPDSPEDKDVDQDVDKAPASKPKAASKDTEPAKAPASKPKAASKDTEPAKAPAEAKAKAKPKAKTTSKKGSESSKPPVVRAQARYVRTSARKARLVCDHIRGKDVEEARAILAFAPRRAAKAWTKLLESAVANAEHNHELVGDDLKIASVYADEGPTLKRFRPRAMGRSARIRKRSAHLTIMLTPKE